MYKTFSTALIASVAILSGSVGQAQQADIGADIYGQYCATCHGIDAKGDGPLSELMTVKMPGLTRLSADNDGEFPMLRVIHIIDGRTGVRAHGGPMPTYGEIFSAEAAGDLDVYGSTLAARGRVMSLALYLETLQE